MCLTPESRKVPIFFHFWGAPCEKAKVCFEWKEDPSLIHCSYMDSWTLRRNETSTGQGADVGHT